MILIEPLNNSPEVLQTMACKLDSCTVESVNEAEFCDCACKEGCELKLPVFALVGGTDKQNDMSSFLFRVLVPVDTGDLFLYKKVNNSWVKIEDLDDNTFGTFYDFGSWTQYPGQELYIGYKLNWLAVYTAHGHGEYYVKAELTALGQGVEQFSNTYNLLEYSDERADGTVSIHSIQNGNIRRSAFDWTGMEWNQWLRIPGFFGFRKPTFITEEYLLNDYKEQQIQDEIRDEYTLEINAFLTGELSEELVYRRLMSNEIFITDYNLCNTDLKKFCNFPVKPASIEDPFEDRYRSGRLYVIKFTDRVKDNFKRNYK